MQVYLLEEISEFEGYRTVDVYLSRHQAYSRLEELEYNKDERFSYKVTLKLTVDYESKVCISLPDDRDSIPHIGTGQGQNLPRYWMQSIDKDYWQFISPCDEAILLDGCTHTDYWDAWQRIIDTQFLLDVRGDKWYIKTEEGTDVLYLARKLNS